jgi:hypothetical protein
MSVIVNTFTEDARTYEVASSIDDGMTWISQATGQTLPWTDANGEMRNTLYRVRDDTDGVGNEGVWSPAFYGAPDSVPTCKITGDILIIDGCAGVGERPLQILIPKDYTFVHNYFFSSREEDRWEVYSDSSGHWEIDLPQGMVVKLRIPDIGLEREITVPSIASATLASIL